MIRNKREEPWENNNFLRGVMSELGNVGADWEDLYWEDINNMIEIIKHHCEFDKIWFVDIVDSYGDSGIEVCGTIVLPGDNLDIVLSNMFMCDFQNLQDERGVVRWIVENMRILKRKQDNINAMINAVHYTYVG